MTFQERAKLVMEALAKQEPVTFEQARAQALRVEMRITMEQERVQALRDEMRTPTRTPEEKEDHVKHMLKMYHPDWNGSLINAEFDRLLAESPKVTYIPGRRTK